MTRAPRVLLRLCSPPARGAWLVLALVTGLGGAGVSACEAVGDGQGLPGRSTEVEISNAKPGGGRHESWAPRGARLIMHAGFDQETDEYSHNVLGDLRDTKQLTIHLRLPGDERISCPKGVTLPAGAVFEDIAPRLVDLDADGMPEIIAVRSTATGGASLVVFDRFGREKAATPPIGRRNRWLAPIGAADLDGDGHIEIAYIDRPHLAKTLRIWRYKGGTLREITSAPGYSNHRIGWNYIEGGIRDCGQAPEMLVATGDWSNVVTLKFDGRSLTQSILGPYAPHRMDPDKSCQ